MKSKYTKIFELGRFLVEKVKGTTRGRGLRARMKARLGHRKTEQGEGAQKQQPHADTHRKERWTGREGRRVRWQGWGQRAAGKRQMRAYRK